MRALYRACWGEGKTLGNSADVLDALAAAGIDTAGIASRLDTEEVIAQLEANTDEAAERGVFGAKTARISPRLSLDSCR